MISLDSMLQWRPALLREKAGSVDGTAESVESARSVFHRAIGDLTTAWSGTAADAAVDCMDREQRHSRNVRDEITELATALRRADTALADALEVLRTAVGDAEAARFTVDEFGGVRSTSGMPPAEGERTAGEHAERIRQAMVAVLEVDAYHGERITSIASDITTVTPDAAAFSPTEGADSIAMLLDGDATPEDIGRVYANLAAAGLDPDALEALARGEIPPTLPAGSIRYLEELYREAGVQGFLELQQVLADDGSPTAAEAGRALSAGLMALSHENVHDEDGLRGGFDRLPDDVRALVQLDPNDPPAPTLDAFLDTLGPRERAALEADPGAAAQAHRDAFSDPAGDYVRRVELQHRFWEHISEADGIPGTELGVELVKSSAVQVDLVDPSSQSSLSRFAHLFPESVGEPMLDVATRNIDTSTRILTGDLDGNGTADTQRDDILNPLFTHSWNDNGAALGGLTSWMTEEKYSAPEGEEGQARRDRADTAAFGLAQYLSHAENYERLMDMDGPNSSTIGEVNPALLHSTSRGLMGYIPSLAGVDTDSDVWKLLGIESSDAAGEKYLHAQRVFTLMATGDDASAEFMGAAMSFQEAYDREYARSIVESSEYGTIDRRTSMASFSGQVQALTDRAYYQAAAEQIDDRNAAAELAERRRAMTYDTGYTMARNVIASFLPANLTAGLAMDMANPLVRDHYITPATAEDSGVLSLNMGDVNAANDRRVLRHMLDLHGPVQDPEAHQMLNDLGISSPDLGGHAGDDVSAARIVEVLRNATEYEFGPDHLDTYTNSYLIGYSSVAELKLVDGAG